MQTRCVDPRDQIWEVQDPRYRVYFVEGSGVTEEFEVEGADVAQVLEWADVGYRADLILLQQNSLEDIAHFSGITGVVRNGHWYSRSDLDTIRSGLKG